MPVAAAASVAIQIETPRSLNQNAMKAEAVITAAKARLRTFVTANWSVKPTDAIASTEAATSPKAIDETKTLIVARDGGGGRPPRPPRAALPRVRSADGRHPCVRQVPEHLHLARGGVGVDLEDAVRLVVAVEPRRSARPDVGDRLVLLERRQAGRERVHDHLSGRDLLEVRPVVARLRALGRDHRERREVDAVVEMDGAGSGQVGGEVARAADLPLLGEDRGLERLVGLAVRVDH